MRNSFVNLVRKSLKEQGMSLRQLAKEMGVQASFLSRTLTGHRKSLPDQETILAIAKILKISPPEKLLIEAGILPSDNKLQLEVIRSLFDKLNDGHLRKLIKILKSKDFLSKESFERVRKIQEENQKRKSE